MSSSIASDMFRSTAVVFRMCKKLCKLLAKLITWTARKVKAASIKNKQKKAEMQRLAAQQQAAESAASRQNAAPAATSAPRSAQPVEVSRPVEITQTKPLNLSQCIVPRAVDFNGGKKLTLARA
ncbi:MAG: hypothetical protein IJV64_00620 [Oscillospiraceae bacterium]|nr:hypothetical protein [Oscillospiraceae bacterium]